MSQQIKHIHRLMRKEAEAQQRAARLMYRGKARYERRANAHCRQAWKFGKKAFKARHKFVMEFINEHPAIRDWNGSLTTAQGGGASPP